MADAWSEYQRLCDKIHALALGVGISDGQWAANNMTPHSAMVNTSNLIRLSIDVRAMPESDIQPVVGKISSLDDESLHVITDDGTEVPLYVDKDTYICGIDPSVHPLGPGKHMIAFTDDTGKRALVVRLAT